MEEKAIIIFLLLSFPSGSLHQNTGNSSWITRNLGSSGKSSYCVLYPIANGHNRFTMFICMSLRHVLRKILLKITVNSP